MPPTIRRITTAAVVLVLFAVPATQAEARSRPDLKSVARNGEKQIQELEQRLSEPYGADTWFIFTIATVEPDFSGRVTISRSRGRPYRYAQMRVGRHLVFRSSKVQGARAAAQLIWQAQQAPTPLQFYYRGFENEEQADAFHKLMGR